VNIPRQFYKKKLFKPLRDIVATISEHKKGRTDERSGGKAINTYPYPTTPMHQSNLNSSQPSFTVSLEATGILADRCAASRLPL